MNLETTCSELQELQRQRAWFLKSRIMVRNRLQATVAGYIGYEAKLTEKERREFFAKAGKYLDEYAKSSKIPPKLRAVKHIVTTTMEAVMGFDQHVKLLDDGITQMAKTLPVYEWVCEPEQKGFGAKSLGVVVGEAGNLDNYSNPGKFWKRMGLAPYTSKGKTLMGGTWTRGKEGKLTAEEWTDFGYSRRRRSVAYVIAESLLKGNGTGPYRTRYNNAREVFAGRHSDYSKMRCHLHGMCCSTKLLFRNLWREWTGLGVEWEEVGELVATYD